MRASQARKIRTEAEENNEGRTTEIYGAEKARMESELTRMQYFKNIYTSIGNLAEKSYGSCEIDLRKLFIKICPDNFNPHHVQNGPLKVWLREYITSVISKKGYKVNYSPPDRESNQDGKLVITW